MPGGRGEGNKRKNDPDSPESVFSIPVIEHIATVHSIFSSKKKTKSKKGDQHGRPI